MRITSGRNAATSWPIRGELLPSAARVPIASVKTGPRIPAQGCWPASAFASQSGPTWFILFKKSLVMTNPSLIAGRASRSTCTNSLSSSSSPVRTAMVSQTVCGRGRRPLQEGNRYAHDDRVDVVSGGKLQPRVPEPDTRPYSRESRADSEELLDVEEERILAEARIQVQLRSTQGDRVDGRRVGRGDGQRRGDRARGNHPDSVPDCRHLDGLLVGDRFAELEPEDDVGPGQSGRRRRRTIARRTLDAELIACPCAEVILLAGHGPRIRVHHQNQIGVLGGVAGLIALSERVEIAQLHVPPVRVSFTVVVVRGHEQSGDNQNRGDGHHRQPHQPESMPCHTPPP